MTEVFVEQPLASPGSANYIFMSIWGNKKEEEKMGGMTLLYLW